MRPALLPLRCRRRLTLRRAVCTRAAAMARHAMGLNLAAVCVAAVNLQLMPLLMPPR